MYYTVFLAKTDEVVAFGNAEQCAKKLGLKNARQFHAVVSKTSSGIHKRYVIVKEPLDDDEIVSPDHNP